MTQKLYKFKAATLDEAYKQMRRKLGREALVVNTAHVPVKGVMGFLGRRIVEVTASVPAPRERTALPFAPARPRTAVERKYMESLRSVGSLAEDPTLAYYEKLVSSAQQRIAQNSHDNEVTPVTGIESKRKSAEETETTVVPFPRKPVETSTAESMRQQMREMREMLQVLMAESPGAGLPPEFAPHYRPVSYTHLTLPTIYSV